MNQHSFLVQATVAFRMETYYAYMTCRPVLIVKEKNHKAMDWTDAPKVFILMGSWPPKKQSSEQGRQIHT